LSRKLLLVNPVNPRRRGLTVNPAGVIPPLALGIVAALTGERWEVEILDENFERFEYRPADLVGLTAFTPAAPRAYAIAAEYRKRGVPTALGGIHASMVPDEALRYVDAVAVGEAESTWPQLVADAERGRLQPIYREDPERRTPISSARHDLFHRSYLLGALQTARGCPMDCDFCSVTAFHGRRYRQRELDVVLDELGRVPNKYLYLVDDNIYGYGSSARERALALFEGIVRSGLRKSWLCQASINFADHEDVLALAARAGCRLVFLGLEAEEAEALQDANKRLNLRYLNHYEEVFRRFHAHGIAVLGGFIYGMEGDTPEALARRTRYIDESSVDAVQLSMMTPLPGTKLYNRLREQGRLLHTRYPEDWVRYDMTEVVFRPARMKPEELGRAYARAARATYDLGSIWRRYVASVAATHDFTTAWWAYASNLNYLCAGAMRLLQQTLPGRG
jgi:radical SAM superfamily enzyme YgiQ (UPF0313 family)